MCHKDAASMLSPTFPDLLAVDLYVSVVQLGSMSRAAAAHGISQPSASGRIRTLERQLGVTLLERGPTGSVPTAEGQLVADWADTLLKSATEFSTAVGTLGTRPAGRLKVVASYTIAEYFLVSWVTSLLEERPNDSVALDVANSAAVIRRVVDARADLGFIECPEFPSELGSRTVAIDELVVVVGTGHPWAGQPDIGVSTLLAAPLILREKGSGTREAFDVAVTDLGFDHPRAGLELGSTSAVRSAVQGGAGPTVISRLAVVDDLDRGSLVEVKVDGLDVQRKLRAIWSPDRELEASGQALLARLPDLD